MYLLGENSQTLPDPLSSYDVYVASVEEDRSKDLSEDSETPGLPGHYSSESSIHTHLPRVPYYCKCRTTAHTVHLWQPQTGHRPSNLSGRARMLLQPLQRLALPMICSMWWSQRTHKVSQGSQSCSRQQQNSGPHMTNLYLKRLTLCPLSSWLGILGSGGRNHSCKVSFGNPWRSLLILLCVT